MSSFPRHQHLPHRGRKSEEPWTLHSTRNPRRRSPVVRLHEGDRRDVAAQRLGAQHVVSHLKQFR